MRNAPSCSKIQSQLWDYAAQRLNEQETYQIALHLPTCEACQHAATEYEQLLIGVAQLRTTSLPASQSHWEGLRSQILSAPPRKKRSWSPRLTLFATASFATAFGAILLTVKLQTPRPLEVAFVPNITQNTTGIHKKTKPDSTAWITPKLERGKPLIAATDKPKSNFKLTNALYKTGKRTQIRKPVLTLVHNPMPKFENDGRTVVAVKFAVDGEMPLAQTRQVYHQGVSKTEYESLSAQRYIMGGVPSPSLISQSDDDKELRPW